MWLPGTGVSAAAAASKSCIRAIEPILGEVAYTLKINVKMIANNTVVCVLSGVS